MTDATHPYNSRKLASLLGVKLRTLRRWLAAGLFSPANSRGPATAYGQRHLQEGRAILRLRADGLVLITIRKRLTGIDDAELARIVGPEARAAEAPRAALEKSTEGQPIQPAATYAATRWEHIELLPGLELRVKADSSQLLRRMAQEIYDRYAVNAEP